VHVNFVLVYGALVLNNKHQVKLVQLGRTQVRLGPVQCQVVVEMGERGFGWDRMLGGADGFGWKLGCSESGVTWSPGGNLGDMSMVYGLKPERASINLESLLLCSPRSTFTVHRTWVCCA